MLDPATIDAVVFDIGGVFLIPHPDVIRQALVAEAIEVTADDAAFHHAHHAGIRAITEAMNDRSDVVDERSPELWEYYDAAYFVAIEVADRELERARSVRAQMRMQKDPPSVWVYPLTSNIAAFHRLADGPRPLAIVSNNDGSAPSEMVAHGVCQVGPGPLPSVVALVDSTIVGVAKPDPAIFEPVKQALPEIPPDRMLYVGDTVHADVRGATNAGMQVVQLDPYDLHADHDHPRLPDLETLVEILIEV